MTRFIKKIVIYVTLALLFFVGIGNGQLFANRQLIAQAAEQTTITLPEPTKESDISIEEAVNNRGSEREYADVPLTLEEISQLMWAAQGENQKGTRTAPSAGALYPIDVYVVAGEVDGLEPGVYKYQQDNHTLILIAEGDFRSDLSQISLSQESIAVAPAVIVLSGVADRSTPKYGERGEQFVYMEVGHVAQNILLQLESLNMGGVTIGAFTDEEVNDLLQMQNNEQPLYVMPIGKMP